MDQVQQNGLLFRQGNEEWLLEGFETTDNAKDLGIMDVVILMVKCTQTKAVMPDVMHCIGEHTVVVSLQNGLDNHEILSEFVSDDRLILGFGKIGTELRGVIYFNIKSRFDSGAQNKWFLFAKKAKCF